MARGCSCDRSVRCDRPQCTYCLTVLAYGRATSALSARYTRRRYLCYCRARGFQAKTIFSLLRVTFDSWFPNRFPARGNSLGVCQRRRFFLSLSLSLAFSSFFNSITISTMHTAAYNPFHLSRTSFIVPVANTTKRVSCAARCLVAFSSNKLFATRESSSLSELTSRCASNRW